MDPATRLRDERARTRETAAALSLRAGLSHGLVALIEAGTKQMGHRSADALAGALGVERAWLLFGEGPRKRRAA